MACFGNEPREQEQRTREVGIALKKKRKQVLECLSDLIPGLAKVFGNAS
jgi:hypothetical protein